MHRQFIVITIVQFQSQPHEKTKELEFLLIKHYESQPNTCTHLFAWSIADQHDYQESSVHIFLSTGTGDVANVSNEGMLCCPS